MIEEIITTETDKYGQEVLIARYDSFRHNNGAYYAFFEIPVEALQTPIPLGVKWGTLEDGDQKSILDFVAPPVYSIDGSKALIAACAIQAPTYRQPKVTKDDLDDWVMYAKSVWPATPLILLNIDERNELLRGDDYGL